MSRISTFLCPLALAVALPLAAQEPAATSGGPLRIAVANLDLIAAHVDFMNLVVQNGTKGEGGPQDEQLLAALETAVCKLSHE